MQQTQTSDINTDRNMLLHDEGFYFTYNSLIILRYFYLREVLNAGLLLVVEYLQKQYGNIQYSLPF